MFVAPLYIYALFGFLSGWAGGRITAPSGMIDWKPGEHSSVMIQCRRLCSERVLRYEPQTGDCVCQKLKSKSRLEN